MTTRMLIDAAHVEETRVVVIKGNLLDEFDFESSSKKQLKGNIYLAKVTRVEPSLQAAFVDYGGNRHGFLAFNEIHPDYYQIPVADRNALLLEEAEQAAQDAALEDAEAEAENAENKNHAERLEEVDNDYTEMEEGDNLNNVGHQEAVAEDDAFDEVPRPRSRSRRSYKIQEVIKKRQILLVQVVKEERGNKGAALTTYLSLAGRYCVLMPNTARGGGISRKISNNAARRKLKDIVASLNVPEGMGVIVRTAGQNRNKSEIRRDFEYLLRLWDSVRELTLKSTAPTSVYEEASLIKRVIRDLYTKEVDEVLVEGEEGYRVAKDFIRMLLPSHAKKVQRYRDRIPLFHRFQVEQQLDSMHSAMVQLRSGGYLVISPTEALVAIDVNSGRSTKERNIEETALKTNLEAAEETARQLRLRDLAGLVVIDFIDMDENRHKRSVEKRLKDSIKFDRARIQLGRISPFGLMEMSRQRLGPSLLEASMDACKYCSGSGLVRTKESAALHMLRAIEEEGIKGRSAEIVVHMPNDVALYVLNQKREALAEIKSRYNLKTYIAGDEELIAPDYRIEKIGDRQPSTTPLEDPKNDEQNKEIEQTAESERRPRRRRKSRKKSDDKYDQPVEPSQALSKDAAEQEPVDADEVDDDDKPRRRRRGRRGGRRRRPETEIDTVSPSEVADASDESRLAQSSDPKSTVIAGTDEPLKKRKPLNQKNSDAKQDSKPAAIETDSKRSAKQVSRGKPKTIPRKDTKEKPDQNEAPENSVKIPVPASSSESTLAKDEVRDNKKRRRGWWSKGAVT